MARFNCLNIMKCDTEAFMTYSGFVNKQCERFKISTITDEQFTCFLFLFFTCGLRSASDWDVRTRILSKKKKKEDQRLTLLLVFQSKNDSSFSVRHQLFELQDTLAVTLCRWSAKQTILLSVLARNQTKGLDSRSRRDRKWVRERSGGRPVKMSQHSSWVVEFSLEIHASVSLHMHIGNAMLHNSSSCNLS